MSKSGAIRFVLDGEIVTVKDVDPTRTVLQFLREDLRRTGTKEGCAEGDCGTCTVVVAELNRDGDDLTVRAINSCIQFLPTLDGKELITVESLTPNGADLHPVQLHEFFGGVLVPSGDDRWELGPARAEEHDDARHH